MANFILESDKKRAIAEIETFLDIVTVQLLATGWRYYVTDNAPETFKALCDIVGNSKNVPIASYGSESSIYSNKEYNYKFRFWHDVCHLELNANFSFEGECKVIENHLQQAIEFGLSGLALQILNADTYGQVKYYYQNKKFVKNQAAFVDSCLAHGINKACTLPH